MMMPITARTIASSTRLNAATRAAREEYLTRIMQRFDGYGALGAALV
jgi:hypothetical protein